LLVKAKRRKGGREGRKEEGRERRESVKCSNHQIIGGEKY